MDVSALTTLVGAATDGMRKTQSADEIQDEDPAAQPQQPKDGHQSDSAVPPTRERKKGASTVNVSRVENVSSLFPRK